MHIRVLLSRYRSYTLCPDCHGARLKPESLYWRAAGSQTPRPRSSRREKSGSSSGSVRKA